MTPRRRLVLVFVLFSANLLITAALSAQENHPPHWTYEGEDGPAHWGELDATYEACALGGEQSPIDLTQAEAFDLVDVQTSYQPSALTILNNGHTIQVNYDAGSTLTVRGLMKRASAISGFVCPSTSNSSTSISRDVKTGNSCRLGEVNSTLPVSSP